MINHLTTGGSGTNATSYATASITPTANALILAAFSSQDTTAPPAPTLSGCGLTWVLILGVDLLFNTLGTPTSRLTIYRAMGASPSAGAVTADYAGNLQLGAEWSIIEVTDADQSGTDGSGAIVQGASIGDDTVDASHSVTLGAFSSVDNYTVGFFTLANNTTFTEGAGFTIAGQSGHGGPNQSICSEYLLANDTSVDITSVLSGRWGGCALEIKKAAAAAALVAKVVRVNQAVNRAGTY